MTQVIIVRLAHVGDAAAEAEREAAPDKSS